MNPTVIQAENVSKLYRLGEVGTGTLRHDFNRWWHKVRGKEDPYRKIGQVNHRAVKGASDYVWALKDINFSVKQGEVLGIIGRNGAGKSTLLKILSRVTTPTTGGIKVKGRIASLLEVGTGFNPDLTGRDNIYLNGAILGMRKREIDRRFDEIVDFSEVERYIDTPVKRYSSGMYVRLAFAVAAHLEPEILIVDEVLAVGDAEFQQKCLGKMRDVSTQQGRTVLFVSHHMAAISKLTNRCLVMAKGTVALDGPTRDAVDTYLETAANEKPVSYQLVNAARIPGGNGAATFISAGFDRPKAAFEVSEDIEFHVTFRATKVISKLRVSLTVCTPEGTPVGSTCSRDGIGVYAGEVRELQIRIPQPRLAPGHYYCILALGAGSYAESRVDFDVIADTLHFEVAPATAGEDAVVFWNVNWGRVVLPEIVMDEVEARAGL
jgi:lipopolysaccharide transport system ATP-binding protein